MKPIVIDPSAAAAWVMPDEKLPAAGDLYAQARTTPNLFHAPYEYMLELEVSSQFAGLSPLSTT